MAEWRVGPVGTTLYRDGELVGGVETPELAAEIVETMNRVGALLDDVRAETAGERSHAEQSAGGRVCYCPRCRSKRGQPRDAERRSEATPKNDLDLLGPSRVDPYDTTKGGITE